MIQLTCLPLGMCSVFYSLRILPANRFGYACCVSAQGEPTSNKWHIGVKLAIVVLVVGLSITCIVIKWMFFVWLHHLEKKLTVIYILLTTS